MLSEFFDRVKDVVRGRGPLKLLSVAVSPLTNGGRRRSGVTFRIYVGATSLLSLPDL